jgi:hypothetical protein
VMLGYYGNDDGAAATIEPDGWLHSGDVATMEQDGYFTIVDRMKDMILTAGFNVYPAEIERVLCSHPAVALAAVGGVPDETKGELAKAYVVLRPAMDVCMRRDVLVAPNVRATDKQADGIGGQFCFPSSGADRRGVAEGWVLAPPRSDRFWSHEGRGPRLADAAPPTPLLRVRRRSKRRCGQGGRIGDNAVAISVWLRASVFGPIVSRGSVSIRR